MTKFLLSIESVLDSFGFTKQRGICGSLRLTPFLRFFPKSGRNQNQKESAMGSLAPGKECGGGGGGESKKITFQSLLSSPPLRACFATHPVLALISVHQWNGKMSPIPKDSYMIRFQPSLQIGVIFVFAFFCRTEARRSANLVLLPSRWTYTLRSPRVCLHSPQRIRWKHKTKHVLNSRILLYSRRFGVFLLQVLVCSL